MNTRFLLLLLITFNLFAFSQTEKKNIFKEKADKLRELANQDFGKKMDQKKEEFDESNYNYAISFIDNSALFEADEKGNSLTTSLINNASLGNTYTGTDESMAYNSLKQGEALLAANKMYLAEQSFLRARMLYIKAGKSLSTNGTQAVTDLALTYQNRGLYAKAIPWCDSAISLRQSSENKVMLAVALNNKGVLNKDMGNYTEAENFIKKAYDIVTEQKNDLGIALTLNNLAMVYVGMNKLKDAEANMTKAMEYAIKAMTGTSKNYFKLEVNQAYVYRAQQKYEDAEGIYKKAIMIKENNLGASTDLAQLKSGLAELYVEMGKYNEVEKLLKSAYDINKRKLGENNPATVKVMQAQANYYRITGDNAKAHELIKKVLQHKMQLYGENHPSYIQALEELAIVQWNLNDIASAKETYQHVLDVNRNYISTYFNTLNENEKNLYWEKTRNTLQRYYGFVHANYNRDSALVKQMLNTVIVTKGFLLNGSSKLRNTIMESGDAELKAIYKNWLETKENLNSAYQLSKEELAQEKINIDSLQKKIDEYERQLSQKSSLFNESNSKGVTSYDTIQKLLLPNEAAIEIVQVNEFRNKFTGRSYYLAIVLTKKEIVFKEIGNADSIDKAVGEFRANIIDQKPEMDIYPIAWSKLDSCLNNINKVYLSVDGAYHQLSINALKDKGGNYVIDKYNLQFVGNMKDVASLKKYENKITKPKSAFLIGNPMYGKNELIPQLPGTEKEVKSITATLKSLNLTTTTLYGEEATETKIKAIKSPNILHIATHGYFLADVSKMETNKVLGIDISVAKENPLLRSGLLLANCDNVFDENYRATGPDNGVLTAYEAMSLNLDKTDLVVLSACETGLGSVKQGEGVYGLQRAFLIAGAKSIIMSLWSVSDEATMELMTNFYSNYAKTGNKQVAFVDAQKKLKTKYKDPFYWSAFVMLNI